LQGQIVRKTKWGWLEKPHLKALLEGGSDPNLFWVAGCGANDIRGAAMLTLCFYFGGG
jgi:hypothetical protein